LKIVLILLKTGASAAVILASGSVAGAVLVIKTFKSITSFILPLVIGLIATTDVFIINNFSS
jgi:hypothetical protein